ncbi:nuclear pore complex subunit, partial [Friedmanniomyces endolithicus]
MADLFSRITPRDAAPAQNSGGGMFGSAAAAAPATTRPTGASLFSMAPTSTTGGGGGLFGATASTGGGLFGGTAATATSQPASTGMFKSLASAAPLGNGLGNLFGGTSNAPMQPAATGSSLFGNTFGGNTQTSQPTGASLFGGAAPSQAANSLFASTANNNIQAQGNANASVFGTNVLPSQQSLQQPLVQRAYDPNVPAAQPSYFQALLDKGNKRMVEDNSGLPQLQYGLQDIQRKVRNVGQGGPSAGLGRGGAANTRS